MANCTPSQAQAAVPKKRPEQLEVRAQEISFYTDLADPQTLRAEPSGRSLWPRAPSA